MYLRLIVSLHKHEKEANRLVGTKVDNSPDETVGIDPVTLTPRVDDHLSSRLGGMWSSWEKSRGVNVPGIFFEDRHRVLGAGSAQHETSCQNLERRWFQDIGLCSESIGSKGNLNLALRNCDTHHDRNQHLLR